MIWRITLTSIRRVKISQSLRKKWENSGKPGNPQQPAQKPGNAQKAGDAQNPAENVSFSQAQSILDMINKARMIQTDKKDQQSDKGGFSQDSRKMVLAGLTKQDTVQYFDPARVKMLREKIEPKCPQVHQYLKGKAPFFNMVRTPVQSLTH